VVIATTITIISNWFSLWLSFFAMPFSKAVVAGLMCVELLGLVVVLDILSSFFAFAMLVGYDWLFFRTKKPAPDWRGFRAGFALTHFDLVPF